MSSVLLMMRLWSVTLPFNFSSFKINSKRSSETKINGLKLAGMTTLSIASGFTSSGEWVKF